MKRKWNGRTEQNEEREKEGKMREENEGKEKVRERERKKEREKKVFIDSRWEKKEKVRIQLVRILLNG